MFGNDKLWDALSNRLDQVEKHVQECAKRHEVDEVKADLKENLGAITEVKDATTQLRVEFAESRRWIGVIAALLAFAIPILGEIGEQIFPSSHHDPDPELQKQLIRMEAQLEIYEKQLNLDN